MTDYEILDLLKYIASNDEKIHSSQVSINEVNTEQPTYCVSVPTSSFIVKQENKISVTGNCHVEGLIEIFKTIIKENKELWDDERKSSIYSLAQKMTDLEIGFIDYVYNGYDEIYGLHKDDLKQYIKYIVDRRLIQMGMKGINKVKKNPLQWVDEMITSQNHENFFETRATSYAKGALSGSWGDVWGNYKV